MNRKEFYREVYEIVAQIPLARVATYGQIARLAGRPRCARMVGQSMHNAPPGAGLPCHRVVNSRGETAPFWPGQKKLLEREGVAFRKNGSVDLKKHQWELADFGQVV